jgi:hypothetical protein
MLKFSSYFQVITEVGPKIVLPNRFAQEIRNHPDLHFGKAIALVCTQASSDKRILTSSQQFFGSYPGFDPFGNDNSSQVIIDTVRGKLTQSLSKSIIYELKYPVFADQRSPRLHN